MAATIFVQENLLPRSSVTENYLFCMRKETNLCHKNEALVLNRVEKMNAVRLQQALPPPTSPAMSDIWCIFVTVSCIFERLRRDESFSRSLSIRIVVILRSVGGPRLLS